MKQETIYNSYIFTVTTNKKDYSKQIPFTLGAMEAFDRGIIIPNSD